MDNFIMDNTWTIYIYLSINFIDNINFDYNFGITGSIFMDESTYHWAWFDEIYWDIITIHGIMGLYYPLVS
jgi:hypothetical protein